MKFTLLFSKINQFLKKIPFSPKTGSKSWIFLLLILVFLAGILAGTIFNQYLSDNLFNKTLFKLNDFFQLFLEKKSPSQLSQPSQSSPPYLPKTDQEKIIIEVVKKVSPSVVSIVITKEVPLYKKYYESPFKEFEEFFGPDFPFEIQIPKYRQEGKERRKVGGGTGFIISEDGLILTNKHVVSDQEADYSVVTNDGKIFPARLLARDPFQDLAVLKIEREKKITKEGGIGQKSFPVLKLGDSSKLEIGQTVIAIGNALGEFRNTVSVGVISGLGRTITASGGGIVETLEDVIQTDAAINRGNSGGPLLNLRGEVIGVNVAMAQGAQSIGFAIPINKAKRAIWQVKTLGKIVYPFLGVRYILITPEIQQERNLKVDYGALIVRGDNPGEKAVIPGSQAEKAGLREGDIILEVDGKKVTPQNSLAKIIQGYQPGDKILLQVLRGEKRLKIEAILGEKSS